MCGVTTVRCSVKSGKQLEYDIRIDKQNLNIHHKIARKYMNFTARVTTIATHTNECAFNEH